MLRDYVEHTLEAKKLKPKPAAYKPEGTFQGETVYSHEYTVKEAAKRKPMKPLAAERTNSKFSGEPTYTSDYKQWELSEQKNCRPKYNYSPSAKFEGEPMYKTDYKDHGCIKPPDECRPQAQSVQTGPVDAENYQSSYQKSYMRPPNDLVHVQPFTPKHTKPDSGPFSGISTFTADYIPKNIDKQKPFRPEPKAVSSDAPFSQDTTHRMDYKEWPTQEIFKHLQKSYRPNSAEFIDDTTYNANFVSINAKPAKPFKPLYCALDPNREFLDKTNYCDDFRKWPISERRKWSGVKYQPPQVCFEGESIQHSDFIPHTGAVKEGMCTKNLGRNTDVLNANGIPFTGETNYHYDYTQKELTVCPAAILDKNVEMVFERENESGHKFYAMRALEKPVAS